MPDPGNRSSLANLLLWRPASVLPLRSFLNSVFFSPCSLSIARTGTPVLAGVKSQADTPGRRQRVEATCQAWCLNPALGCLHAFRSGRPSLACDLMEPFRVPVVDRLVVALLHRACFSLADFVVTSEGGVRMQPESLKRWLLELERHLHAAPESGRSFQVQLVERVQRFAQVLPPLQPPSIRLNLGVPDFGRVDR